MINQYFIQSILNYDENTGIFTWKKSAANCIKVGQSAGTIEASGYIRIKILQKKYLTHRLAWLFCFGKFPSDKIDHKNGIRHDNKISNLREATSAENNKNAVKRKDNISGYKGVCFIKTSSKWMAYCNLNGKQHHLGCFNKKEDANLAYQKFAQFHHGDFYSIT